MDSFPIISRNVGLASWITVAPDGPFGILGVRPLSFSRVPLYASGEKTVKAPVFVSVVPAFLLDSFGCPGK